MTRTKQQARKRPARDENDPSSEGPQNKKVKQEFSVDPEPKEDDEGNLYWSISSKRRLQVSDFKGVTMVSVREYYEKDGRTLPGKGISLNIEQFNAMVELLPQVESLLVGKDLKVSRPRYEDVESGPSVNQPVSKGRKRNDDEDGEDDVGEPDIKPSRPTKDKLDEFKPKANHEATSDEDN